MASIPTFGIALLIPILLWSSVFAYQNSGPKIFNVRDYGARANGHSDDSKAFLKAWHAACQWGFGESKVLVPRGRYMLNSVTFMGPCLGRITFRIEGSLRGPTSPSQFLNIDTWIGFQFIDGLTLEGGSHGTGGGVLDGQGPSAWKYNTCNRTSSCPVLPVNLRLDFITNSTVQNIISIDSKNTHIHLFACQRLHINHIRLTAPEGSPNTDGIKIGNSTDVKILGAKIETGDDCIAMVFGSKDIDINQVQCGPGHGISIGSLGRQSTDQHVQGITVSNTNFTGTQNGVRIKTWSPSSPSLASDIVFQYIRMENVNNPIFIDQQYCPYCGFQDDGSRSQVQINNVTYRNIQGTSSSKVAVSLQCSEVVPCRNVKLEDINLRYNGVGGPATASCSHVHGTASGEQLPSGCL
ncbi:OLC1v1023526C1 [Oldenlandia corymbosa var. corymbosa]|uniref:OLC1v1023526C1 n=1 Tax=Oldenlandia corymbosa var. corymbosa TaxID=529605 RepID=A0AAV1C050_OLDCO|nr:OLC1v1023526C1 [Oldenlandia corymbosa var. corymbosa]